MSINRTGASVCQILSDRHGIAAIPGKKVTCPFCGHTTLAIKRDDTLAKCFHPRCGRFITTAEDAADGSGGIGAVLAEIFAEWHSDLLSLKHKAAPNAYSYVVDERRIHPQVVQDSMLGAVPDGYDVGNRFAQLVRELEDAVAAQRHAHGGTPGQPPQAASSGAQERLSAVHETVEKLERCVAGAGGWLTFFYTDARHEITGIRFREPYSKRILYFKLPSAAGGVFGHSLFTPDGGEEDRPLGGRLIVVEGEFNELQLQSLCLRYAESVGSTPHYAWSCAVGGVNNADLETMRQLEKRCVVCYDHDEDGAGFQLVANARELGAVEAFTTPEADSDLDDFIRAFGDDNAAAWKAVNGLFEGRTAYERPYEAVAADVYGTRQRQAPHDHRREFEVHSDVARLLKQDLTERANFCNDGLRSYVMLGAEKQLVEIDPDDSRCVSLLHRYGLNRSEQVFRYVLEELRLEALEKGLRTEVHRLSHYDANTGTLYLSNCNNGIYRITADAIELVDNGTDGVLFLTREDEEPFTIGEADPNVSLLDELLLGGINFVPDALSPDDRRLLFLLWIYAIFFDTVMPTKPLVALIGPMGSAKTSLARKVGLLLFGSRFEVTVLTRDARDFDAAVTNSKYVVVDNADQSFDWLDDRLAIAATGGTIKRRAYYTTNRLVAFPVRCYLALTSRTPYFRREDVADRLLMMRVERLPSFKPESMVKDEILSHRDAIMSELVSHLQDVIRALREAGDSHEGIGFRMADFADLAIKVARYLGIEPQVREIFQKLGSEQSYFVLEDEPVFDLLLKWARENRDREVTNADLFSELSDLAQKEGMPFPYPNTRSFAQRMSNLRPVLDSSFEITQRTGGGRKNYFTFKPRGTQDHDA